MKSNVLIFTLLLWGLSAFAQADELEKFRTELTAFVNYDNGKSGSLPKSASTTLKLKKNMESAFMAFVLHKDSRNTEGLKKTAAHEGSGYRFNTYTYFFNELRRDFLNRSPENNINYHISFYGLYDYDLPNFVSICIQPFKTGTKDYVIYYYKLKGSGVYYIKDIETNTPVFSGEALTPGAAILKFEKIDKNHFLLVEDMGNNGQRALVLNSETKPWKIKNAFKGRSFSGLSEYSLKTDTDNRTYLRFAETKSIISMYGESFLKKYEINFDEASGTVSYRQYNKDEKVVKTIRAKWENNLFKIDDYYVGRDMDAGEMPYP